MSKVLVIAEHDGQSLNLSTAKTVACAADIDGASIDVVVFAAAAAEIAAEAAKLDSVSRVLTVENPANANALAAVIAPQVVALAGNYSHAFAASTTFGKDLMPRVAALLGVNQISDIMSVLSSHAFKRRSTQAMLCRRLKRRPISQLLRPFAQRRTRPWKAAILLLLRQQHARSNCPLILATSICRLVLRIARISKPQQKSFPVAARWQVQRIST